MRATPNNKNTTRDNSPRQPVPAGAVSLKSQQGAPSSTAPTGVVALPPREMFARPLDSHAQEESKRASLHAPRSGYSDVHKERFQTLLRSTEFELMKRADAAGLPTAPNDKYWNIINSWAHLSPLERSGVYRWLGVEAAQKGIRRLNAILRPTWNYNIPSRDWDGVNRAIYMSRTHEIASLFAATITLTTGIVGTIAASRSGWFFAGAALSLVYGVAALGQRHLRTRLESVRARMILRKESKVGNSH